MEQSPVEPQRLRYSFFAGALRLQGSVATRVARDVLIFGLIAAVIVTLAAVAELLWGVNVVIPHGPFSAVGAVLGLLLVLRTNAGYDRWWEARKLWGGIVNQSRNLAAVGLAYGPRDAQWRTQFVLWVAAFPHVIRHSLREERILPEVAKLVGPAEATRIASSQHMPSCVSRAIADQLNHAIAEDMDAMAFFQAEQQRSAIIDYLGGCERIRKTPLPRSSAIQVRRFILLFLFSLPLAFLGDVSDKRGLQSLTGVPVNDGVILVPLFIMAVAYPLLSLDRIGMELQNPFDVRRVDHLPLDGLCHTIEKNLMGMLRDDPIVSTEGVILETMEISPELAARIAKAKPGDTFIS